MSTSLLHILTIFILLLFPVVTGDRCPRTRVSVINMCSNEVKTGSRIFLDINIKPEDNINNCSCLLQVIQPDANRGQTHQVIFTPFYPSEAWCGYSLTVTHGSTIGIYDCTNSPLSTRFELKPTETLDMLFIKGISQRDQYITRCLDIQSDAATSFTLSCSLPKNQQPSIATTAIPTDIITDPTIRLTSTLEQKSELDNTQINTETPVGAIIGGVLGIILVIGGVILSILVWRCYRAKTPEEDNTYSSLDLQNNVAPTDVTYQGLQNNPPPSTATTPIQPSSRRRVNENLNSHQQTATVDTDPNPTSSYENLVSRQPTATDQNYENLTSNEHIMNHPYYERLTPNQQASTVHEYESLPGT